VKHLKSNLILALAPFFIVACNSEDQSTAERRDFAKLERALGDLSAALPEDRTMRLEELQEIPVNSGRLKKLKNTCMSSYREFNDSNRLLVQARTDTRTAEAKMEELKNETKDGGTLAPEQIDQLRKISAAAGKSLSAVSVSLDRAEKLVGGCEKQRQVLRALITAN
jgi:hypothetical protein